MISDEQYEQLVAKAHRPKSLLQFFRESPLVGLELDLEWDKDVGRDIEVWLASLLAATAIHHDLTVVWRNVCDFVRVEVLNPWESWRTRV
jgi:hypothetical protein